MLTGLYSYGQAARLTHAYAAALSSTVDPIRSAPLATEHHPGQQQRHRQHRRRPMPIWVLKKILKTDTIPRSTRLTNNIVYRYSTLNSEKHNAAIRLTE